MIKTSPLHCKIKRRKYICTFSSYCGLIVMDNSAFSIRLKQNQRKSTGDGAVPNIMFKLRRKDLSCC